MAQIKSQMKRIQTNEKARQRNVAVRSRIATESKKVRVAVEKKDVEGAKAALKVAIRLIDKSVTDGVYARNTAARKKSSLTRLVNELAK
ncbi:MAG: 30S ribosomal protein S20 [Bacilli bacterium]|nr:30S ribosomal protein S20 [Bacilli bacterium]